jgi:hypothetical protein
VLTGVGALTVGMGAVRVGALAVGVGAFGVGVRTLRGVGAGVGAGFLTVTLGLAVRRHAESVTRQD